MKFTILTEYGGKHNYFSRLQEAFDKIQYSFMSFKNISWNRKKCPQTA
jgi:hypothetical protein